MITVSIDSYLSILRARWLTILAVIAVSVIGTAVYSYNATPRYVAHAGVFFSVSVSDNAGTRARGFTYQQRKYARLHNSRHCDRIEPSHPAAEPHDHPRTSWLTTSPRKRR